MQTSSIRTSAIALCALVGLTACEQNNLISQPNPQPDSDPGASTASAKEEAAREGAASALAASQLATQGNRPEMLKPESTRIKTSLGNLPTLNSRRYLPLPQTQAILPRLNLAPAIVPRSTWKPPASFSVATQMPTLPTAPATLQPGLGATAPNSLGASNSAPAGLSSGMGSVAAQTSPVVSQPNASQLNASQPNASQPIAPASIADVQGHWSQPIVAALLNANIVQGFADGSFRPDAPITEDQFVGMVQRAFPDEAISSDAIHLRPGMTRAEAAKVVYQALAEQGKMAPLSTLVVTQSQPLDVGQVTAGQVMNAGQSNTPIANSAVQPDQTAVAAFPSPSPQPASASPASNAATRDAASDASAANKNEISEDKVSLPSEIAQPMLQAAVLAAEAVQPTLTASNPSAFTASNQSSSPGVSVAVMGEVSRPGGYSLVETDSKPTLIQAIQMAGGVTATANIRQIQVRRAGAILTVDLWQVLQTGNLDKDLALQSGDTIAIPRATNLATVEEAPSTSEVPDRIQVSVVGEVNKPGILELPPNALANQAIMASGGFNRQAQKADLIRLNANGTIVRRTIAVDMAQGTNDLANPRLQNNDVILVQRSSNVAIADQWTALNPLMKILPPNTVF